MNINSKFDVLAHYL